jgi:hypothetical protein
MSLVQRSSLGSAAAWFPRPKGATPIFVTEMPLYYLYMTIHSHMLI